MKHDQGYSTSGLLPPEEVKRAAEVRVNTLMLVLFAVVMIAVFGAFLVTNRQWSQVRARQQEINVKFEEATEDIRELQELEEQQGRMVEKAVLASSLIERVPRSILLAELINRMPERLSILEFELRSDEYHPPKPAEEDGKDGRKTGSLKKPERAKTKAQAEADAKKQPEPVKYLVSVSMLGAAPNDTDVSRYMTALTEHELLKGVRLEVSEAKDLDGRMMRQFRIGMRLDLEGDVRDIEPLVVHRSIGNPMNEEEPVRYDGAPEGQAIAAPEEEG